MPLRDSSAVLPACGRQCESQEHGDRQSAACDEATDGGLLSVDTSTTSPQQAAREKRMSPEQSQDLGATSVYTLRSALSASEPRGDSTEETGRCRLSLSRALDERLKGGPQGGSVLRSIL